MAEQTFSTNNWSDYGGMDVYVNQILGEGQPHDYFYSNPYVIVRDQYLTIWFLTDIGVIKAAFQNYVKVWVERYVEEPTIFGWELGKWRDFLCTISTVYCDL
jgi:mannan endo-1,4-beta-mannosidase